MKLVDAREKYKELHDNLKNTNSSIKIIDEIGEEIAEKLKSEIITGLKNIGIGVEMFSIEVSHIYSEEGPYVDLTFDNIILYWYKKDLEVRPRNSSLDSQIILFTLTKISQIDKIIRQSIISV